MGATDLSEPRPETFGLTPEEVRGGPRSFVTEHRVALVVSAYAAVAATVFALLAVGTGSFATAAYLTAVLVAAASIVLVPALVCMVCLGERAEVAWLCRRFPKMQALADYRRAFEARRADGVPSDTARKADWGRVDRFGLAEAVRSRLERAGCTVTAVDDREAAGYDLDVRRPDGDLVVVRCVGGRRPATAIVGRELLGAWTETGARLAVLVAPSGVEPGLSSRVERSPTVAICGVDDVVAACGVGGVPEVRVADP